MSSDVPRDSPSLPLSPVERGADGRLFAPAVVRNAEPIAGALEVLLRPGASVLEIGSGTGEHLARFARRIAQVRWQPSEVDAERLHSIESWRTWAARDNLLPPLALDVTSDEWGLNEVRFDLVLAINLLHMVPGEQVEGVLARVRRVLSPGGYLVLYAPWRDGSDFYSDGNRLFDEALRANNSALALRDIGEVTAQARRQSLRLHQRLTMPANNHLLVFEAEAHPGGLA